MSTYKRSTGNIVFQTLEANSSVSFIGPTANAVSVVINGDLSVSGNASLTGNIAGDKIFNGTTSIDIPSPNGNIAMSVGGVSNVVVVSSTGTTFAGSIGFTGNISAGNVSSNGIITAIGNVSTSGNLNANGNIVISRDASAGQPTFIFNDTDTTVTTNTVLGAVEWYTSDLSPGGRVTTAVRSIATSDTGNARFEVLTSTGGSAASAKFVVDNVGNVGVANTAPLHTFAVSGNTYTSGTATVIGNVTGGNYITAGLVSATGNITSAANIAGGNLSITSNVAANNLSATTRITAGSGGVSATGNITGGNLISQGIISATGNLTTTDIFATTVSASGNITGANVNVPGVANTGSVTATSTISAVGNVTGGNIGTAGRITATGNVVGGNVNSSGLVSAAGNIVTGAYFVGDGGFLSNVTAVSNLAVSQLANGVTNLTVRSATGPITADVNAVANVLIITDTSLTMTGVVSATGNVVAGNVNTAGIVSATGNINGGNVNATFGNFNTVIGAANASNLTTGTVPSDRLTGIYAINISGYSATVSGAAQPNITSVGNMSSLSVVGNTTSGNLITGGLITATGNITGGNLVTAGTGNINTLVVSATASVTGNVTGGNLITGGLVTATGNLNTSGGVLATGNVTGGNIRTGGLVTATGNVNTSGGVLATGNVTSGNVNTGGLITATGNVTGGNINTGGLITATGNINTSAGVSATGNVSGAFILGNITFATGYNASKIFNGTSEANIGSLNGNANISINGTSNVVVVANTGVAVSGTMSASGTVTGGNLATAGTASATGNVTGGNVNTAGLVSAGGNVVGGNITTSGQVSATGAITGASLSVSTGNISGGNLNISGGIYDSSQLDIQTTAVNANIVLTPNGTGNVNIGRMSASGNITAVAFYGNGASLSALTGANVTGTVANATYATSAGSATSATTAGTVTTAAQPNITSVGTLSSLAVTANITGGNLSVSTGTVTLGNIVNANGNGVGNIGSSTTYFNRVFATATTALYADLAEKFLADQPYAPGTVLVFGGDKEVTQSTTDADHRVAGVVSTNPSYTMNSGLDGDYAVELALQGRVPCAVVGPVAKGDLMVSAPDGRARAVKSAAAGTIIGKSLENFNGDVGIIEIVVGRD
jgi:hypothetical protein